MFCAFVLSAFMTAWGWQEYRITSDKAAILVGIIGVLGILSVLPYYSWFRRKMRLIAGFAAAFLLLRPDAAMACSVCFGDPNSPMIKGVKMGILLLLSIVGAVLASIAGIAYTWARRARALENH